MSDRKDVLVFGGTKDGRMLAQALAEGGIPTAVFVATEYGADLIPPAPHLTVHWGRMTAGEMEGEILQSGCSAVVDATHPYAREVTGNIRQACCSAGKEYLRLLRGKWSGGGDIQTASSPYEAAAFLAETDGNILLTTGSKEMEAFARHPGCKNRIVARILPMKESLDKCISLGLKGKQIVAMQGPFTHEMNVATIRQYDIRWLVTKDSGDVGGFYQKLSAAEETGTHLLVISRPLAEEGLEYQRLLRTLLRRFGPNQAVAVPECSKVEGNTPRFPMFINIKDKQAVIIGGGKVALRRARTLMQCGARVTVVAPSVQSALASLSAEQGIQMVQREYSPGDLSGAVLAVAATDAPNVNRQVAVEAEALGIPCNVADDPKGGSFWFPGFINTGKLSVGLVSTDGDHSAVKGAAQYIRTRLGEDF